MSDEIWDVLGIAPTRDVGAIRRAYAVRLKRDKNDLDPRAFQALRDAYEAALALVDGGDAPSAPPTATDAREPAVSAQRSAYASALHVRRMVVTEPAPARHERWKDIVGPRGEEPPPGKRRKRDRTAESPASGSDERERVGQALSAVAAALVAGDAADAVRSFEERYDALSHPVNGVSIAALAAFERQLVRLIDAHLGKGDAAGALGRAAARRLDWAQRVPQWDGGQEPLEQACSGFIAADALERCARGERVARCPVSPDFARKLLGPLQPIAFASSILGRAAYRARRAEWLALESMEGRPLAWIAGPSVAWWREAMRVPRLFPNVAVLHVFLMCVGALPLVAALTGAPGVVGVLIALAIGLVSVIVLLPVGLRQDRPALASLRPVWAWGAAVSRFLDRSWELQHARIRGGRFLVYPLFYAALATGLLEGAGGKPVKPPAALLVDFLGWLAVMYGGSATIVALYMTQHGLGRLARELKSRLARMSLKVKVFLVVFVLFPLTAAIFALVVTQAGESPLYAMRDGAVGALVCAAVVVAVYGVKALVHRIPSAAQPWAWGAVCIVAPALVGFVVVVGNEGPRVAFEASAQLAGSLALVAVPIVVAVAVLRTAPHWSAWLAAFDRRIVHAAFPPLRRLGIGTAKVLACAIPAVILGGIIAVQPDVDARAGLGAGLAAFAILLAFSAWRGG